MHCESFNSLLVLSSIRSIKRGCHFPISRQGPLGSSLRDLPIGFEKVEVPLNPLEFCF